MEYQEPWLTCSRKGKVYLLAKDESAYFLIEVGKSMDYSTEEWLQQQGVSEELLKELRLNYQIHFRKDLRGVAVGGATAGDTISLYPKIGKRQDYTLELDYEEDFLEGFFVGIPRFQPPKITAPNQSGDWRKKLQDPELFEQLRIVPPVCVAVSICAAAGYALTAHWIWFTLCLICLTVQFGLLLGMPAYFTLVSSKKKQKHQAWNLEAPLWILSLGLFLRNLTNWLSDNAFWIAMGIGVAAGLVVYVFLRDLHEVKGGLLAAILFGALAGWCILGQANQVYDFKEPESYILEVQDMHKSSSRRSTSYYCTVTLPDGREENLEISRKVYDELDVGDPVRVEHSVGVLGIEYAIVYPLR